MNSWSADTLGVIDTQMGQKIRPWVTYSPPPFVRE
jgi:hypothetical protein